MAFEKKELKKKSDNVSDWYNDAIVKAEIADYGPVRGTMVIRPYGYAMWEQVQEIFNRMIKKNGVENAYFPMFIPMSFLQKEKEHVKGFAPELAVVTIGGGETLTEPLAVRPTSETIMYECFRKWIGSYRDLPLKINQWSNVVRWEKRTYLFLRTLEFLWQEGHTAHATHEEALSMVHTAREWYQHIYEDYLAVPVMMGKKSETEKFAGAVSTFAIETLMPDGKSLQSATSHDLGQNFAKSFDVTFQSKDKGLEFVWQTSWGLSTRALGGMFLAHGDDDGLIIPPMIASIQAVIIPIVKNDTDTEKLLSFTHSVEGMLQESDIRTKVDERDTISVGRKFNAWEVKGVPLRIEIGDKELESASLTVVLRDTHEKMTIAVKDAAKAITEECARMQKRLYEKQKQFLTDNTHDVTSWDEFKKIMETTKGYLRAFWCEDAECEKEIKDATKATTRCLPLDAPSESGVCIHCGKKATHRWIFAQSY